MSENQRDMSMKKVQLNYFCIRCVEYHANILYFSALNFSIALKMKKDVKNIKIEICQQLSQAIYKA